ncbi:FecR domain-containing protein [Leptospira sp. 2 VSF19]|uniref:FecR domain-containing protein n=1 Tax=Leptospira soteropolitanensis TaxID=2950025 RepID=A0AAW5VIZ3_9LEPT|nr:FecR domain-containing protein [Leptospira soteropolitanensis]MCW7492084.1 FecR domain-containing protein [Leptospira soteropolitanensis]MCW7499666.1 FecR domain-containing protein [Leptospira soteropolitanensis]MCW7521917.1 FecR domain-containing protein [Leptospira soteropolitanensis]MCW7525771.1 FecR domain-containing protein [Leptospira soteropolitanensis]MCW7530115.1 FecR domain-containing protein [Leptospira soteropolitanensis]
MKFLNFLATNLVVLWKRWRETSTFFMGRKKYLFSILFFVLFCLSNLTYKSLSAESKQVIQPPDGDGITIIVEKGQTLSIISKTYLDDPRKWKELLKSNQIDNPNLIIPGMKLWIPKSLGKKPLADLQRYSGKTEVLKVSRKSSDWIGATIGEGLYVKDEVRTFKDSEAQFLLLSGSRFEITENSHVIMEKGKSDIEPDELYLRKGRIRSIIQKKPSTNQRMFLLKTESAVSEVRGTDFLTEVDPSGNTILSCYEGLVAVTAQNVTVNVSSGFATFVEKGKPPLKPFSLPDPPKPKEE